LPPDDDHPYGHGKFEAIGSLFLALTLFGTGISVGVVSNKKLLDVIAIQSSSGIHAQSLVGQIPTFPALFMAALSIVSKEWLYRITRQVGEKLNSQVVIANAWHHRSDAYSSVLALISIGMAMFIPGFLAADAAAGILVAGMICMTGAEIMGESIKQLTDTSNQDLVDKVTAIVTNEQDVSAVNRVRARQVGSSSIIDVSVSMPEDLTSSAARAIEEQLKAKILREDGVVQVDVRATSPGVVCPLLEATNTRPTASQVEKHVRSEILLKHPEVTSVQGVTVHYQDTLLVNVDVDIQMDGDVTLLKAKSMAHDIRNSLESGNNQIHKANIFLDLNSSVNVRP
jgi:cation diffusion facilitator family transporter